MKKKTITTDIAYSYLRFSSPEQAKGDSVRRQTELRDQWLIRNNIVLDNSLKLRDEGISGYSGKHRENPDRHALATFLELVRSNRIARGSYLIVESLDRLTREHIRPALTLLLNLIDHGIRIVQLLPVETVYDEDVEPMSLMMAIMELSRGHSESRMKSERVGRAWSNKRERAKQEGKVLTKRIPAWLRVVDGVFTVHEPAAATVRRIYALAIEGYGIGQIVKRLNKEGVPSIGRAAYWAKSFVTKILSTRAVLGEFQPHSIANGQKRHPTGDILPHYYPSILSEDEWYAARASMHKRRGKRGRQPKEGVNLFTGLLRDARDGGTIFQMDKGKKANGKILASYRAYQGIAGAKMVSFPAGSFERALLSQLREIDVTSLLPRTSRHDDAVLTLTGRLAAIEGQLAKISAALLDNGEVGILATAAKKLEEEQAAVHMDLEKARQEAATPLEPAWATCQSLIDVLDAAPEQEEVRIRLRAAIRRVVSDMWCLFVAKGSKRLAFVQVWFDGQPTHRDYVIVHHPAHFGFNGTKGRQRTEGKTIVRSMRYKGPVDLRDASCVPVIEQYIDDLGLAN